MLINMYYNIHCVYSLQSIFVLFITKMLGPYGPLFKSYHQKNDDPILISRDIAKWKLECNASLSRPPVLDLLHNLTRDEKLSNGNVDCSPISPEESNGSDIVCIK